MFYAGLIITDKGPNLLEINVRFGDPETQAIIPLLETDLLELLHASAIGTLNEMEQIKWKNDYAMTVVMAANGYPEDFKKFTSGWSKLKKKHCRRPPTPPPRRGACR